METYNGTASSRQKGGSLNQVLNHSFTRFGHEKQMGCFRRKQAIFWFGLGRQWLCTSLLVHSMVGPPPLLSQRALK